MEDLVRTLITGFVISIIFLAIAYFFWRRFDKPTEKMIEHQEVKAKVRHERKMWRAVEAQMSREQIAAEEEATYQRRKAEEKDRAKVPEQGIVSNAWASLGMEAVETATSNISSSEENNSFEDNNSNISNRPTSIDESDIQEDDDSDVLHVQSPVEVRQDGEAIIEGDEGTTIAAPNAPPDWKLVEKLTKLSQSEIIEETPHPEIPQAPELSPISLEVEEELPTIDNPPEHQQVSEESEVWNSKQEPVADSEWAVYWR
ncbi:MAG TPA: hypothetical protein EYQ58_06445 [Candidatus Poseidoniales archaeon]|nr:hypothetical protein [Candidatus Poseidoniales archaeon]